LEPQFLLEQPFFWPLLAHAIAMSTVIWNPLLFFWLTKRKRKSQMHRFSVSFNAFGTTNSRTNSVHRKSTLNRASIIRNDTPKLHLRNGLANTKNYLTVETEQMV
ncbi:unnamed protein product, partial [Acanthocheilonema viteae]